MIILARYPHPLMHVARHPIFERWAGIFRTRIFCTPHQWYCAEGYKVVSVIGNVGWWSDLPQPLDKIDHYAAPDDHRLRRLPNYFKQEVKCFFVYVYNLSFLSQNVAQVGQGVDDKTISVIWCCHKQRVERIKARLLGSLLAVPRPSWVVQVIKIKINLQCDPR